MTKRIMAVVCLIIVLITIGVIGISAYRSSESYRREQVGKGETISGEADMPEKNDSIDTEKTQITVTEIGLDINTNAKEAIANGPYGSIELAIPDTWKFEICGVDDERLSASFYGIVLWPIAENKGCIEVGYTDSFGVCGTGLEMKSVTLANNEAHVGYYDGNSNWSFITWGEPDGELKNITVLCNADWGAQYLDELLAILDSIQFDENNQTGGIGVYQPSSELGIDEGYLWVSAKNVTSTGATLVFNYSIYRENEVDIQEELYFGSYLPISKKVGGEWVELEYKNDGEVVYDDIAYIIKENEDTTYEYDWERIYGSLDSGEYQIAIEINSEVMIYAYFILR